MVFIDVSIVVAHIDVSEGAQDVVYDVVSNNVVYFFACCGNCCCRVDIVVLDAVVPNTVASGVANFIVNLLFLLFLLLLLLFGYI